MHGLRSRELVALVAVALMLAMTTWGAPVPAQESDGKAPSALVIKPSELAGTVLYSDGKSPVAKAAVRVWSVDDRAFVHHGATDAQGAYALPKLAEGRYIALFADRVRVDLVVDASKGVDRGPLKVIIPRGKSQLTPRQIATELVRVEPVHAGGAGNGRRRSLLTTSLIVVGGTTAAIGVYELLDDDKSSHHRPQVISP